MKKILFTILCIFLFVPIIAVTAEEISRFDMQATINEDATVDIVETILYNFGADNKHGIYRDIPVKYKTATGSNRSIDLDDIDVTDENGQKRTFVVSKEGKNKRIKIGNASKFVTGEQTYVISYTVNGAINYFDDHDEFYWNVTGDDWPVHIKSASSKVQAPNITMKDCFTGRYGSTKKCSHIAQEGNFVTFAQGGVAFEENMTVVVGMQSGVIYKSTFFEKLLTFILDNWILFVPVAVFFFMWNRWRRFGKDPEGRGIVVPYYESPDNLSPAEVGMIIDEKVHSHDISALFINLAVKGCIHIRKRDGDYTFVKLDKTDCNLVSEEQMLYDSIFEGDKTEVSVSSLKNEFYTDFARIAKDVVATVIKKGYYAKDPRTVRITYMVIGGIVLFASFFVTPIFGFAGSIAAVLCAIPIMAFGFFMPRLTKKGAIAREQILGLKLYMNTAEKDRINFHNAPEKNPKQFEKLLPYAMALDVEKKWAQQFEDVYTQKPDWYDGTGAFTPAMFARDMSNFSSKTSSAMVSQPASASSGSSGFSSGGSGGGFGGGGGGSW